MKFKHGLVVAFAMTAFLAVGNLVLAAEVIKIAIPTPLTGPAAGYGDNVKAGVAMKIEEINAKGGVNGKKIEAVYFDEQCDPKEAATVGTKIAGDKDPRGHRGPPVLRSPPGRAAQLPPRRCAGLVPHGHQRKDLREGQGRQGPDLELPQCVPRRLPGSFPGRLHGQGPWP